MIERKLLFGHTCRMNDSQKIKLLVFGNSKLGLPLRPEDDSRANLDVLSCSAQGRSIVGTV